MRQHAFILLALWPVSTFGCIPPLLLVYFFFASCIIFDINKYWQLCCISGIDPMTVPVPSASTTSTIKVNTRVEDRPARLVSSGYVAILIGLVLLVWAGLTAYGAFSRNSYGDVHFSVWALVGALCLLAIAALSCVSIYSLQ